MTTVYPQQDLSIPLVDPVDQAFAANRKALATTVDDWAKPLAQPAAQIRIHRTLLQQAMQNLPRGDRDGDLIAALSYLAPDEVAMVVDLIRRAKASAKPCYTPPLALTAGAVEAIYTSGPTTHAQVLDARNETSWHNVRAVLECEEDEEHDHAAKDCVVLLSDAWADGGAHLPADWDLSVRIMAEVTSDDTTTWQLRCSAFAEHPDDDLRSQNERLLARVAELENAALKVEPRCPLCRERNVSTPGELCPGCDEAPLATTPATSGECGGGCPTS